MADSLFDNRYRYDYIYPRGRSGETLRAVDTQDNNRRVVIKRPAPGDAPPIRAGQEVSIVNERRALRRLASHPVLTELLGEGSFNVGGMVHQYIVMERAEGIIIGDLVGELAASGERMAELEMLVVLDNMLDLLRTSHAKDIVYNDVDARHLFWNRDNYRLKMIDWGNAVFLEGDAMTPQGVSRQTDIFQVGELLFFVLTGGRRADIPRDAGNDFVVDFGDDSRRVHSRLQEIVSRALHPNLRLRYPTLNELRSDLAKYRAPLEQQRNAAVAIVVDRLRQTQLNRSELRDLLVTLEPALSQDAGYPPARNAYDDIINRLRDLSVSADLDAVRIYMTGGNWLRAGELLRELQDKTGPRTAGLVGLLLDVCLLLNESPVQPAPESVMQAITMMFDGQSPGAATMLLLDAPDDNAARILHWQIAERVSAHIPEVMLLRPNLYRLQTALRQLAIEGYAVTDFRAMLADCDKLLDSVVSASNVTLSYLRDSFRTVVEQLSGLSPALQRFAAGQQLPENRLPLSSLDRSLNAAMALADNTHVIGKQATADPRDAMNALDLSRAIDPPNPVWDELENFLDGLYDYQHTAHDYIPAADGTDLDDWLKRMVAALTPFTQRLFDDSLTTSVKNLDKARSAWQTYRDVIIQGDKDTAVEALQSAAENVVPLSPTLGNWFNQLKTVVNGAQYPERHSVPGGLGRALADGWQAFDNSRLSDAERLGQQAYETARSESERFAASRLQDVARLMHEWVERGGVMSQSRTKAVLDAIEQLLTPDEKTTLDHFNTQMPSIETYLKAMSRGLVSVFARRSTAGLRLLMIHYLMQSSLDASSGLLEDSAFWREAGLKTMPEVAEQHIITRTLDAYIARSYDLVAANALFVQVNGKEAIPNLAHIRQQLETNPQARLLQPGIHGLREIENALHDWSEAEFRSAGQKLENAIRGVDETEQAAGITLTPYRSWLMDLIGAAADLHVQFREIKQRIETLPTEPDEWIGRGHHYLVDVTEQQLGNAYSPTLRQWRDTYDAFAAAFGNEDRRSKRLERFNELFRAMFIDRHPAYPLYRHWYSTLEGSSEFPAPVTDDPTPRIDTYVIAEEEYRGSRYRDEAQRSSGLPRGVLIGGAGAVTLVLAIILIGIFSNQPADNIALTITATPNTAATRDAAALIATEEATMTYTNIPTVEIESIQTQNAITVVPVVFATNTTPIVLTTPTVIPPTTTATPTNTPSLTPTLPTETPTPTLTPTETLTPTITNTPTLTYTPSITPSPTLTPLPPQGVQGEQDVLALLNRTANLPYNPDIFAPADEGWRLGVGSETPGDILYISLPPDLLEATYGNNAASRIRRVEASIRLRTFNPAVVSNQDIFFGVLLQSINDGNNAGIRLQVFNNSVIILSRMINNNATFLNQRSVNEIVARLRIDRDVNTGNLSLYFNDIPMGEAFSFLPPDTPLQPVLFVRDGGVVVGITDWRITLR
jgi:serine/threonine protein kinase